MTSRGHSFARYTRLIASVLLASTFLTTTAGELVFAQPMAAAPQPAAPAQPGPLLPMQAPPGGLPGVEMTLDQAAPAVMPIPAPPGQGVVQRIVVEGTQRIEPDSVLSYLLLHQGQPYDPAVADRSLKVLFDTGLFSDVRMDWDGMTLTVRVVENPILNQVVYEGNSQLSDADLNKEVQVRPRMVFTRARVQADVVRIIELYRRSGRFGGPPPPHKKKPPPKKNHIKKKKTPPKKIFF
jgi:outer membrane protein insertion porin family